MLLNADRYVCMTLLKEYRLYDTVEGLELSLSALFIRSLPSLAYFGPSTPAEP